MRKSIRKMVYDEKYCFIEPTAKYKGSRMKSRKLNEKKEFMNTSTLF